MIRRMKCVEAGKQGGTLRLSLNEGKSRGTANNLSSVRGRKKMRSKLSRCEKVRCGVNNIECTRMARLSRGQSQRVQKLL